MAKAISILLPVYNEEANIPEIYNQISSVFNDLGDKYDAEYLFINDGSTDGSLAVLEDIAANNDAVRVFDFSRNFGKEIALTCGIHHAQGDAILTLDTDLQHPVELIPEFLQKWEDGAEVVIGVRKKNKHANIIKRIGSRLFYWINGIISSTDIIPHASDFRLIDRVVADAFNDFVEKNRFTRGLIDWLGFKRDYIHFDAHKRYTGTANYGYLKLFKLAFTSFVTHSLVPLRLAGYLGACITLFSMILGVFVFLNNYVWKTGVFSGIATVAVFIMFLIGIVLICLGLIALYIGNIHNEVIGRPLYVLRQKKKK